MRVLRAPSHCNTAYRFSRPSISQEPTGCSNIGDSNCRALQNNFPRLLFGSQQEAPVSPDPLLLIDNTRRGMSAPRRTCNRDLQWVFLVNKDLPPGHADVVGKFLLANQKGHAVTLRALFVDLTEIDALDCEVLVALQSLSLSLSLPLRWLIPSFST